MILKEKETKKLPSHKCFYAAGGVFMLYGLLFPLYRLSDYLIALAAAAAAFAISSKLLPYERIELPEKPVTTGDALADSAVREGREYMASIRQIRGKISSRAVAERLSSIEDTTGKILSAVGSDPKEAPKVRRLISYYLPTLIKLADYYRLLEEQGGDGENARSSMARIEQNLGVLDQALKKQLDILYENDALDISTDITVMEGMLAQEGLSESLGDKLKQNGGEE